jgi:hypothetical protein
MLQCGTFIEQVDDQYLSEFHGNPWNKEWHTALDYSNIYGQHAGL